MKNVVLAGLVAVASANWLPRHTSKSSMIIRDAPPPSKVAIITAGSSESPMPCVVNFLPESPAVIISCSLTAPPSPPSTTPAPNLAGRDVAHPPPDPGYEFLHLSANIDVDFVRSRCPTCLNQTAGANYTHSYGVSVSGTATGNGTVAQPTLKTTMSSISTVPSSSLATKNGLTTSKTSPRPSVEKPTQSPTTTTTKKTAAASSPHTSSTISYQTSSTVSMQQSISTTSKAPETKPESTSSTSPRASTSKSHSTPSFKPPKPLTTTSSASVEKPPEVSSSTSSSTPVQATSTSSDSSTSSSISSTSSSADSTTTTTSSTPSSSKSHSLKTSTKPEPKTTSAKPTKETTSTSSAAPTTTSTEQQTSSSEPTEGFTTESPSDVPTTTEAPPPPETTTAEATSEQTKPTLTQPADGSFTTDQFGFTWSLIPATSSTVQKTIEQAPSTAATTSHAEPVYSQKPQYMPTTSQQPNYIPWECDKKTNPGCTNL